VGITRRDALKGLGVAVGSAALGCSSNTSGFVLGDAGADGGGPPPPPPPDGPLPRDAPPPSPDAMVPTEQLLAGIDTFVVLCMENRSFDHYLGSLALSERRTDIEGLVGTESNPDPNGASIYVHRLEDFTPADPPHSWNACHQQWGEGRNDGFVRAHAGGSQSDVMGYHTRDQLPITYALADGAAICQRYFASVMGPTWPNRFYLHAATSRNQRGNAPVSNLPTVFDRLQAAGKTHTNYFHDVPWAFGGYGKSQGNLKIEKFFEHAEAGTLPNFSLIDPMYFGAGANDDHPSHDIRMGQALIATVFKALAASPQWNRCLFVLTYDEHGGFYDHVAPPTCDDEYDDFKQLGFRVPTLVAGPTVRRGAGIATSLEHASLAATLTARFGLEPLGRRAQAAATFASCIDPARIDDPQPAPELPMLSISQSALAARPAISDDHAEIRAAFDAARLGPDLDRRGEADAITRRVLAWGERLGAIQLVD